ncbi:MAG: DUF2298 domain-containing protein [Anaerolineae bacterium]
MEAFLIWYAIVTALGLLAWPLIFRLLPGLPDRGYSFSRTLGLLLVGYVYWVLVSLGILNNSPGGALAATMIIGGLSLWAQMRRAPSDPTLRAWASQNRALIIGVEALFLLAFAAWAVVRAYNPDILYTEKPMELAFVNGVRRSEVFPPQDPWLSGYSISYYYFGYVLVAMLADLGGTASGVAFNLGIALLFALTVVSSYGMVYNLVAANRETATARRRLAVSALIGPLLAAVIGNLAGLLDLLRGYRLLPQGFWTWLDIIDLNGPLETATWPPSRAGWWWWRASRVIHDRDIAGVSIGLQPIDEFPFFSFLLGDMHPHVLALPFAVAALGLAFNALRQREELAGAQIGLYVVAFGGLAFLNTWDLPIYLFVLLGALLLRQRWAAGSPGKPGLLRPLLTAVGIAAAGLLAYLPWLLSFGSQAGGILPNVFFPTRLQQLLVMFGPFFVILIWFLADGLIRGRFRFDWATGVTAAVGLLVMLATLMVLMGVLALRTAPSASAILLSSTGLYTDGMTPETVAALVPQAVQMVISHRLARPLTALFLTALIAVTAACLLPRGQQGDALHEHAPEADPANLSTAFVLWMILTGLMLVLGPEFVYLRDNFGQRLNTIFKFYYAAWLLFALASAYALHTLSARQRAAGQAALIVVSAALIAAGLIYTIYGLATKTNDFTRPPDQPPTLDGLDFFRRTNPAEYEAILWLSQNAAPDEIVLEAVGGAYTGYARVSSMTGLQTVIGWANHERQWRGSRFDEFAAGREEHVREIYNTSSLPRALELLRQYDVTYIFVGSLERSPEFASSAGVEKFERVLTAVYRNGPVAIYRVDRPLIEEAAP